jgi:spermidine synthase
MYIILATLGFTSIIGQVVLMRELVAVFYGNELAFGLILAWWLLWEAAGAWGLGHWADRKGWGRRALALTLIAAALLLPLQIALTRSMRDVLGVTTGAFVPLGQMVWAVGLVIAPYCLAHGLGFSLAAKLLPAASSTAARGASAGRAYAYESAGAVVGGALFSFILVEVLDPFQAILLVTAVTLTVVLRDALHVKRLTLFLHRHPSRITIALLVGIVAALPLGAQLHRTTLSRQWPRLLFADDSRYGRLTITGLADQRAFFENGLLAFETESAFPEEVVHLPLLAHPAPRRVLLIGGGVAGDLAEIFKHDITEAVYLELDPLVIQAAQAHLPPDQAAVLADPRLSLIYQDGRRYTKGSREPFDVVIADLPEPSTGQLNRFYTLEFFQEVKALLAAGGVFSLGLPSAENYWNPELARRNASVYRTLRQVFPTVLVTPGDTNFFLATTGTSLPTAPLLSERLQARELATRWVSSQYFEFVLEGDRFRAVRADLDAAEGVKLNRDMTPICYFYNLALWVSRFGSGLRGLFETTSLLRLGWLILPLAIATAALWKRRRAIRLALVAGTGFAGMTLQVVLLLAFQALYGYVYHQVGLLVTAFMAGLALGAGAVSRQSSVVSSRWLLGAQGGLAVYALALAWLLPLELPAPELVFPLLAGIAGGLTGAVFPLAASLSASDERAGRAASLLYGADLMGGCVGALAASLILVPVLGVVQTCLAVALVAGVGALLSIYHPLTGSC